MTGVFGFLLCIAGLLSIKVTSPVTHMVSSVSLALMIRMNIVLTLHVRLHALSFRHCLESGFSPTFSLCEHTFPVHMMGYSAD